MPWLILLTNSNWKPPKTIRANNIPIRVDHVRKDLKTENNLSTSKSKVPKEVSSAKALLCFFKKIHHNDAPLVIMKTESEERCEKSAREVFERRKGMENPMIKKFQNILDSNSKSCGKSRTSNWSKRRLKSFKKDKIWTKISCLIFSRLYVQTIYRISANSFRENCSFLNLEIVENSNSCRKFQFLSVMSLPLALLRI